MKSIPKSLIRIHAEITNYDLPEDTEILKKYCGVKYGDTISRDILLPAKMPLASLAFVLMRAFGFTYNHCYEFESDGVEYGTGLYSLEKIAAQGKKSCEDPDNLLYDMYDFPGGSLAAWYKAMYQGNVYSRGYKYSSLFNPYAPKVSDVLPVVFTYDFGDNWHILVEERNCEDLLSTGRISEDYLEIAVDKCRYEKLPVLLAYDGDMPVDGMRPHYFTNFMERYGFLLPDYVPLCAYYVDETEHDEDYAPVPLEIMHRYCNFIRKRIVMRFEDDPNEIRDAGLYCISQIFDVQDEDLQQRFPWAFDFIEPDPIKIIEGMLRNGWRRNDFSPLDFLG